MAAHRIPIDVDVKYTAAELASISIDMRDTVFVISDLESEKKSWDAIQNGKIKEKQAELEDYAERHKAGKRTLSVMCELSLNFEARQREWIAVNDFPPFVAGEIIKVEPLKPEDTQLRMPLDPPKAAPPKEDDNPFDNPEVVAEVHDANMTGEPDLDTVATLFNSGASALADAITAEVDAFAEPTGELVAAAEEAGTDATETAEDVIETLGIPEDDDNPFSDPGEDADEDGEVLVTEQGAAIDHVKPPQFSMTPAHMEVLTTIKGAQNSTEVITFRDADKRVRAAAEHLIGMGYIEGEDHENVVGLTRKGRDLFKAGYVTE